MIKRQLILLLLVVTLTACNSQSDPTPEATSEALEPTEETVATETEMVVDISLEAEGERLFREFYDEAGFACSTCHYPTSDDRLLGPGLLSIEERFETYDIEVDSLETYIRQSIVDPTAFIVPNESPFPENIMPRTYAEIFSDEELDALVAFILNQ